MNSLVIRTMPGGPRNGKPERLRNYRYQGTGYDVLTAWMDEPDTDAPCGQPMPRSGQRCGRREGHNGHCKSEETIAADRATSTERSRRAKQRKAKPHGTLAAYRRHLRHGETACESCLQAVRRDWEDRADEANARRSERREASGYNDSEASRYREARQAGVSRNRAKAARGTRWQQFTEGAA